MAEEARRALALDRPLEAAALFEAAADESDSPLRDEYLLRAATIYARGGDIDTASTLLDDVDTAVLDGALRHRYTLVRARVDLYEGDAESAWRQLREQPRGLEESLVNDWRGAQADALRALGRHLEAARIQVALADSLPPGAERERRYREAWRSLTRLTPERIGDAEPSGSAPLDAWLELARQFRRHRIDQPALEDAVHDWRRRHPGHPARELAAELLEEHIDKLSPPDEVALMLPLSGRLAAVGQAIKHGFMAAYFQDAQQRPRVRLFDVGEDGVDVVSAYRDAVESGIDLVIGPLTKQSLEMLSVWDTFPVPVLALNTVGNPDIPHERFYQFGLAPEDDARATAALMAAEGYGSATVLVPDSEWGDRIASAFRQAFEAREGRVLERAYYQPKASDFGDALTGLFNLDASQARFRALQRTTRAELKFEPRRRQDMDAVFFAAYPQQARLIQPQIRFHHGIDLPTFATSHAYSGEPRPSDDQDMDGLRIVEIPWLLNGARHLPPELALDAVAELWPEERARFARLIAMGIDAYQLAPVVDVLREFPGDGIPAATGWIHVTGDGVIHRLLPAAEFQEGRLVPLDHQAAPFGMPGS